MNFIYVLVYNIITQCYFLAIHIAARWNDKAKRWVDGRKGNFEKLQQLEPGKKRLWLHAASFGEFEQGRPLIDQLNKVYPDYDIVITFYSPSGYDIAVAKNIYPNIFYLPPDSHSNAKRFLDIVNPSIAIFIKYEFWYHYIEQCHEKRIPSLLVSAVFRHSQPFFKNYGMLHRRMLKRFSCIFVQNDPSKKLLAKLRLRSVILSGDTRFDRVIEVSKQEMDVPEIVKFCGDSRVLVAGSTWPEDEKLLIKLIQDNPACKFIIVPHEVEEDRIDVLTQVIDAPTIRYSAINENTDLEAARVLLIDNYGMLAGLYRFGYLAYVGGGFDKGIHNCLEAAVYQIPVIFGKKYHKFKEATDMVSGEGAVTVHNYEKLSTVFNWLLVDDGFYKKMSNANRIYFNKKSGATDIVMDYIRGYVNL